jgi:hypothetical protein
MGVRLRKHATSLAYTSTAYLADTGAFGPLLDDLHRREWAVYAKRLSGGPTHVVHYLGRYTNRVGDATQYGRHPSHPLALFATHCARRGYKLATSLRPGTPRSGKKVDTRTSGCGNCTQRNHIRLP